MKKAAAYFRGSKREGDNSSSGQKKKKKPEHRKYDTYKDDGYRKEHEVQRFEHLLQFIRLAQKVLRHALPRNSVSKRALCSVNTSCVVWCSSKGRYFRSAFDVCAELVTALEKVIIQEIICLRCPTAGIVFLAWLCDEKKVSFM